MRLNDREGELVVGRRVQVGGRDVAYFAAWGLVFFDAEAESGAGKHRRLVVDIKNCDYQRDRRYARLRKTAILRQYLYIYFGDLFIVNFILHSEQSRVSVQMKPFPQCFYHWVVSVAVFVLVLR